MHWIALQPQPEALAASDPLRTLGWWALQYTPRVALLGNAVLLEVSGSERLWGGRAALLRHLGTAPKPVVLARLAQGATSLLAYGQLVAGLSAATDPDNLPLAALLAARPHLATLARIGCTRWGQLRALPRGGVSRRFGAGLLGALDQAYGSAPDVYPWLVLPEVFAATLVLDHPVEVASALLFVARRLLAQLAVWLVVRQRGVLAVQLTWQMDARHHTDTQGALLLRTAKPTQNMAHLQRLLAERLAQVTLAAPVQSLWLQSVETSVWCGHSKSLLGNEQPDGDSLTHLTERLGARLGPQHVLQLQPCLDHRPEHMQAWTPAAGASVCQAVTNRSAALQQQWASALYPSWLLAEPLRLAVHQQVPQYQGPLTLLAGPQRLESGWWDAPAGGPPATALRDYFVARNPGLALLWIYRKRLNAAAAGTSAWYLHGLFA